MTHEAERGESSDLRLKIGLPLPLDMVVTLTSLIGAAYPGAAVETSNDAYTDRMVIRIPDGERRKPKRLTKAQIKAAMAEPAEADEEASLTGFHDDGITTDLPEVVAMELCSLMHQLFEHNPEAVNYLEMTIHDRDDPSRTWLATYCRSPQQTPHELRRKAEAERDEALAKLADLTACP